MTEMDASLEELAHRIIRQHVLLRLFRRGPVSLATTRSAVGHRTACEPGSACEMAGLITGLVGRCKACTRNPETIRLAA
jgi:hypothetical protein